MEKKLERDEQNKMLAGVAAGLAEYLSVDVTWIRVLFICLMVFGFSGLWIYIILWIAVPAKIYAPFTAHQPVDYKVSESFAANESSGVFNPYAKSAKKEKDNSVRYVTGIILIALGSYFLLDEFIVLPDWISLAKLWPLIFIAIGLVILLKPGKKKLNGAVKPEVPSDSNDNPSQQAETL